MLRKKQCLQHGVLSLCQTLGTCSVCRFSILGVLQCGSYLWCHLVLKVGSNGCEVTAIMAVVALGV